ncbi:MAG: Hsp70 family protein [Legionella sp.]|uniref:Hsp70 family protein n=1 Tax=Legionella sp. TaxID=459 RepID=UPI0028504FC3|nr:Hsp70 family protein [Legionella sp.]
MARVKIDYGIDLGTTNSSIAKMENGEVKIIKSDTQKDTTPSCVHYSKKTILIGDTAYSRYGDEHIEAFKDFTLTGIEKHKFNTFSEFKTTMGSDKPYESESASRSFNSEELSAEVLKALKNYVRDEEISSVVITVPARFRNNQIDATQKATELSGFQYCELLMEPIAASIAFGVSGKSVNGHWLVFDFGGGTFDAALMRVEEGIMKVVDTDGDNQLGGKDLDYAVVDKIIIPYLKENYQIEHILNNQFGKRELRESLKVKAEEAKLFISSPSKKSAEIDTIKSLGKDDQGQEIHINLTMTLEDYENAVAPIFQRAIDISLKMLGKNNLDSSNLEMVLLVGGPTLSQTLRKMLKEQLKTKIDTSIDPMTSVAIGAALFASSKDVPSTLQKRDKEKIQLILKYPNNTVELEEDLGIKIDRAQTKGDISAKIYTEICRKDKGWSSGKVEIIGDAEIIPILLKEGISNGFEITIFDEAGNVYPCEPASFTIIQGFKEPSGTLPYDLGIEIIDIETTKNPLDGFQGLEKNKSIPAKGKGTYKTQKDIRPGNSNDRIKIPIWEGESKTRAINNFPAGNVIITGEDLPKYLPKGSEVVLTIEVNKSRLITFKAYFPDIDETIERRIGRFDQPEYDADYLDDEIEKSKKILSKLEDESLMIDLSEANKLHSELDELKEILENGRTDYQTKLKVMERLRLALKELDILELAEEFPKAEEELNNALHDLKVTNERYGNNQTTKAVEQFEELAKAAIKETNLRAAKELTSQIGSFDFAMVDANVGVAMEISFVKRYDDDFESYNWKNKSQARQLINQAKQIIATNPTKIKLRPIVIDFIKLLPDSERRKYSEKDDEFLTR